MQKTPKLIDAYALDIPAAGVRYVGWWGTIAIEDGYTEALLGDLGLYVQEHEDRCGVDLWGVWHVDDDNPAFKRFTFRGEYMIHYSGEGYIPE